MFQFYKYKEILVKLLAANFLASCVKEFLSIVAFHIVSWKIPFQSAFLSFSKNLSKNTSLKNRNTGKIFRLFLGQQRDVLYFFEQERRKD